MFFILLLFFIHIFFSMSSLTLPWTTTGFLHPFYTFTQAHRRVFNHSVIFLPRALQFWVDIFYPEAFFILCSFTNILTCIYQGFPGSRQFFLEVCRASSDPQNTDPAHLFVWFTVIHNLRIQNDSVLNSTIYWHKLLGVKV